MWISPKLKYIQVQNNYFKFFNGLSKHHALWFKKKNKTKQKKASCQST